MFHLLNHNSIILIYIMCFIRTNNQLFDSLNRPLELSKIDELLWSDKCDYLDPTNCTNLNPENYNFVVMQLIRSILAHQTKLRQLLQVMSNKNSGVDVLLLCKTFLTTGTEKLVNILGYSLVTNNRKNHKGGGVAILVKDRITFKKRPDLNCMNEKELENVYVNITTMNGRLIRVSSLYLAPNTEVKSLMDHLIMTISKVNREKNCGLVIGIDQNLDLLKSEEHHNTSKFLDLILDCGLWLVITRPTRITQGSATLFDNIYISKNLQHSFNSAILLDDISDHLPTIALLRQTKVSDKSPIEYTSQKLNDYKISQIHQKLSTLDWNGILNSDDVNLNFERFTGEIETIMNSEAPLQTIQISGKRHFTEPWVTKGLETVARKNRKLYKKTIDTACTKADIAIYRKHRNMLN